jgi:hypothetical protein
VKKRIVIAVALAILFALASCTHAKTIRYFVYVTNNGSNNISAYTINTISGVLSPVSASPFPAGSSPCGVAVAAVTGP